MPKHVLCTLTAARLLVAGTKPGNNLDQCLERYLGIAPAADHSRSDWASMLLTEDQLAYAARDVAHLHDLLAAMESELAAAGLDAVWALETSLLPVVVGMEATGMHVERDKLRGVADEALKLARQATDDLRAALGNPGINPASPGQLLAALRAKGLKLESTAEEALKAADDGHLVPLVLAFREASKRAQQSEALIDHIKRDGRIHGRFEPLGTATGRFSSKEPNLQNIGRGEIREAFTAPEGKRLIVADYSQIELRAAAAIAGETKMIEAYQAGADLHKLTAAKVLGVDASQITKHQRQLGKATSFGLIYGQSAPGLVRYAATSYGVTMTEDEATRIRQAFFRTYGRLRQWHGLSHNQAEEGITEVRTRTGRRRLIPTTASDWERFTALVNTPVQGGTADGMKHALVLIHDRLPKSARIVSTVHDEVVVECREESADQCREIITTAMVEAMSALFPEVPVEVEANVCTTWAEK
jgi:DNA polymerase-1